MRIHARRRVNSRREDTMLQAAVQVTLLGMAGLALPAAAQAQTEEAGAQASASSSASSDDAGSEIIVTARRRAENLQSVPIAVTVTSQEKLQDNNVKTLGDLQYLVPSLSATTGLSRDAINVGIRGQASGGTTSLPGVVAYLNEVPIPTDRDGNLAGGPGLLFDLENVQVLKGPQGTLFGRNSVGGALLLRSARPTNEFGGRVQLGYGNYDNREIDAAINVPLAGDVLLARVAFNGQKRDGFTRVRATPSKPGGVVADNRDYWSLRGSLTFRPSERFSHELIASYSKFDSNGSPAVLAAIKPASNASAFGLTALLTQQQALGIREVLPVGVDLESKGTSLSISNATSFEFSDSVTLRNIFGYGESKQVLALDLDTTTVPLADLPSTDRDERFRQYSEEIQLVGKAFGGRLDWIIGGFYLDVALKDPALTTGRVFGLPFDTLNIVQQDKSKALFAQATYDLSAAVPGLRLTGGLRHTWDDRVRDFSGGGVGAKCTEPRVNCTAVSHQVSKSKALTWTASIEYQASQGTLIYATTRRGYRAGGSNGSASPQFGPEYVTDYELGLKSDWNAGSIPIRTNAAVYYQDYTDIQARQQQPGSASVFITNAATARLWGVEIEASAKLTENLQIGASFDYLNFRYKKFLPGVDPATLLGGKTNNRPPYKYSFNARYRLPLDPSIGEITIKANWAWQDTSGDTTQPKTAIESFGLLNMSLDWDGIAGTPIDAQVFVSNLTKEKYTVGGTTQYATLGYATQRFGEPRMYGLRLRYRFGAEAAR